VLDPSAVVVADNLREVFTDLSEPGEAKGPAVQVREVIKAARKDMPPPEGGDRQT